MLIRKAVFVKSASKLQECPETSVPEFAMIGRSNVGKSSLINMLVNIKSLVKVSTKPWKTQLINFFLVNDEWHLVDLPWYGYASSWRGNRAYWIDATQKYFLERPSLKRVFVLIDGNIPPQKIDLEFIQTLSEENIMFDVIVTKIDKSSQKELNGNVQALKKALELMLPRMPKIFFSSVHKNKWREEILTYIQDLIW